jgi:hypothetical protein
MASPRPLTGIRNSAATGQTSRAPWWLTQGVDGQERRSLRASLIQVKKMLSRIL